MRSTCSKTNFMRYVLYFSSLLWFALLFGCNLGSSDKPAPNPPSPPNAPPPPPVESKEVYLPGLELAIMQNLWNGCNQIDYIFYELPISTSVDDNASAQVQLRHVSDSPVPVSMKQRCAKPIGHVFYKQDGVDLLEADIYFATGCTFYVFMKKGKPVFSNVMTQEGVAHFNQIISSVQGQISQ